MNLRLWISLGLGLLLGAGALMMLQSGMSRAEDEGTATASQNASTRSARSQVTSEEMARKLRQLLADGATFDSQFSSLERMVGRLSDEDLMQLVEEVGLHTEGNEQGWSGIQGWMRSALFAEWGRRDSKALDGLENMLDELAKDSLARYQDGSLTLERTRFLLSQWYGAEINQACFALFRGRLERQELTGEMIGQFLDEFQRLEKSSPGSSWGKRSTQFMFAKFARLDPEAAWDALPEKQSGILSSFHGPHHDALEGIFRGVDDLSTAQALIKRWEPVWFSEEALLARVGYQARDLTYVSFQVPAPPELAIRQEAALALARHDLQQAREWINTTNTSAEGSHFLLSEWASRNPDQAMQLLNNSDDHEHHRTLIKAVIRADPSQAQNVLQILPEEQRAFVLSESILMANSVRQNDLYPEPGIFGIVPDLQKRYEAFQQAIEAAELGSEETMRLQEALQRRFKGIIRN